MARHHSSLPKEEKVERLPLQTNGSDVFLIQGPACCLQPKVSHDTQVKSRKASGEGVANGGLEIDGGNFHKRNKEGKTLENVRRDEAVR